MSEKTVSLSKASERLNATERKLKEWMKAGVLPGTTTEEASGPNYHFDEVIVESFRVVFDEHGLLGGAKPHSWKAVSTELVIKTLGGLINRQKEKVEELEAQIEAAKMSRDPVKALINPEADGLEASNRSFSWLSQYSSPDTAYVLDDKPGAVLTFQQAADRLGFSNEEFGLLLQAKRLRRYRFGFAPDEIDELQLEMKPVVCTVYFAIDEKVTTVDGEDIEFPYCIAINGTHFVRKDGEILNDRPIVDQDTFTQTYLCTKTEALDWATRALGDLNREFFQAFEVLTSKPAMPSSPETK